MEVALFDIVMNKNNEGQQTSNAHTYIIKNNWSILEEIVGSVKCILVIKFPSDTEQYFEWNGQHQSGRGKVWLPLQSWC